MANTTFELVFRGDIRPGQNLPEVKERLGKLFKADAKTIENLFSGRPRALKKNLDKTTAEKYRVAILQVGALVDIQPTGTLKPKKKPKPMDAQAASVGKTGITKKSTKAAAPQALVLSLAPIGSNLLKPNERESVAQISSELSSVNFDVAPIGESLLTGPSEREQQINNVKPSEVADFAVAPVGEDLSPSSRKPLPKVDVDTENLSVEPQQGYLMTENESLSLPAVVDVEPPDFGLAPVGSALEQIKDDRPLLNPDTSGLSLQNN